MVGAGPKCYPIEIRLVSQDGLRDHLPSLSWLASLKTQDHGGILHGSSTACAECRSSRRKSTLLISFRYMGYVLETKERFRRVSIGAC